MIELALLAIFSRLMTWGLGPVVATRTVAADFEDVRAFLTDPANQVRLATTRPGVVARRPAAAAHDVRLRLAPGLHVRASIAVSAPTARVLKTELQLRGRTVAWLTWILTAGRATTEVDLACQLESRSLAARVVVLLGGRRLARRLDGVLAALARASAHAAEDLVALTPAPGVPKRSARGTRRSAAHGNRLALHR